MAFTVSMALRHACLSRALAREQRRFSLSCPELRSGGMGCPFPSSSVSRGVLAVPGMHARVLAAPATATGGTDSRRVVKTRVQSDSQTGPTAEDEKVPFGYTRKDVILIGVGLTVIGFALRYGLEYLAGFDGVQAGNVVQLVMVLGLCLGWVSTYLWRVGNKEMTYAQQLREYEEAVMEKRLEALSEVELEAMLAEVEEEKERLKAKKANLKD